MFAYPLRTAALAAAAMIGLSGCAYNGLHSGVSVGLGNSGYYDPYYGGYGYGAGYSRYGYGYGLNPYWGWYDGFYYPGTGYYIYDRYRRPYRWSDRHRRHWEGRRERSLASGFRAIATGNWDDFDGNRTSSVRRVRSVDQPVTVESRGDRPSRIEQQSQARSERRAVRLERQSAREQRRSERGIERVSRSNGRARDNNRER